MEIRERAASVVGGFPMLGLCVLTFLSGIGLAVAGAEGRTAVVPLLGGLLMIVGSVLALGLFSVQPNQARVVVFLGSYAGSVRNAGYWWTNPFATRKPISLRVRNFHSDKLKVNDLHGNPIEIGAVVSWSVVDTARALFDVESFETFVGIQAETAIRAMATRYPYDDHDHEVPSLRASQEVVSAELKRELQERLEVAGVTIADARISHLAYAPEIAQAMLRRQQAQAVIAARRQIVEGAVGMVQMALEKLAEHDVVTLDDERKAQMVSNLLVVLVGETETQPVLNTGSLY